MNIFVLDLNPKVCASYHCDKHVVKMILETAQILSTVAHKQGWWVSGMYRPTHANHPCVVWTTKNKDNMTWLLELGLALCAEYRKRYGKVHKTEVVLDLLRDAHRPPGLVFGQVLPKSFALAMPDQYKQADPVLAYRAYYRAEKARFAKYTRTPVPSFMM